jgi:uncharacterized protein (DUF2235 family)
MKRLVICCDGTWKGLSSADPTNVAKTARAVARHDAQGIEQIVFYSDGLGTRPSAASRLRALLGLGLDRSIEHAYRFLIFNYNGASNGEASDEIFLFGFSRGAYAVRSLVGLIRKCGILPREHAHAADDAIALYRDVASLPVSRRHPDDPRSADARAFHARYHVRHPRIRFLGVWDTIGSLGLPLHLLFSRAFNRGFAFHDTRLSRIVDHACHAVAIDEPRKVFDVTLIDEPVRDGLSIDHRVDQVWFPGNHESVGGGGAVHGLSDRAFQWMVEHAVAAGLALDPAALAPPHTAADALAFFERRIIRNRANPVHYLYRALGAKDRPLPIDAAHLDASVFQRWRRDPGYRPKHLAAKFGAVLDQG